ncbi:unnamed protein product [Closterium sp. NIES-65]|nr:unnamed protein product [Closterium sp. NIES-65]
MGVCLTMRHGMCCAAGSMVSNNYLYGPLLDYLFEKCINEILYGCINRDFENIMVNGNALINLARHFFFGDGALIAAGCKVYLTEVNELNNNGMWDTTAWRIYGGKCGNVAQGFSVVEPSKRARVALSGNCLTLTPNKKCVSNATQRSTAACQAFCSITAIGPCDGYGACVPLAPASPTNFTCLCDAGYTTVDSGNGSSTCAIVHSTTYTTTDPLSLRQRLRLAQGAAEGLAYLHGFDTPIVHRDIKPANILVTADMQAKVADFGLLKRLTHADADATRVASTPGYVDPDYNRTNLITAKSDVFRGAEGQQDVGGKEAIVDFADLALDYIKSPGTRRPTMKDVAYRLSALIAKHCPDKEDEWESGAKEESASSDGMSSRDVSVVSSRKRERSDGSQSGVSSFMHIGSIGDGFRGWLHLKPAKGR